MNTKEHSAQRTLDCAPPANLFSNFGSNLYCSSQSPFAPAPAFCAVARIGLWDIKAYSDPPNLATRNPIPACEQTLPRRHGSSRPPDVLPAASQSEPHPVTEGLSRGTGERGAADLEPYFSTGNTGEFFIYVGVDGMEGNQNEL